MKTLYIGLLAWIIGLGFGIAFFICQFMSDVYGELKSRYYSWKRAEEKKKGSQ